MEQMKYMNLTPDMIMNGNVFGSQPFQKGDESRQFFNAVKDGDIILVKKMMRNDRFLVYEIDETKQTPLHWAAQRGKYEVLVHLIDRKAHINARDIIGRTPLFNASRMNNLREVKALLAAKANPMIRTTAGKTPYIVSR